MSLEKLAKMLGVDEVQVWEGPKGVAVYVRIGETTHSATIDNDVLYKGRGPGDPRGEKRRRIESIAEHVAFLADGGVHKMRGVDLRKSSEGATRAALEADSAEEEARRQGASRLSWSDVPFDNPFDSELRRLEPLPFRQFDPTPPPSPEPVTDSRMESRFHAIVAELSES